jgi:hypothetical protein
MRRTLAGLVLLLLLDPGVVLRASSKPVQGCVEPESIAAALAKLRERGWTGWAPEELVKTWPRTLATLDCESSKGTCVLLTHKGRGDVTSCECCETFRFEQKDSAGKGRERLAAITIFYSAAQYADVLRAARLLAKTMGLPSTEGPLGQDRPPLESTRQYSHWTEPTLGKMAVLDVAMRHEKVWTVSLSVAWYPDE